MALVGLRSGRNKHFSFKTRVSICYDSGDWRNVP